jgi:exonuclease SbcC
MRIHRLEIFGIGPFRDRQVIDFDELSASGLFLIDGPTATGKTTIIDSITYALFSTLSGEESAKDRMRSDYSAGSDRSEIILDFSVNGVKHKVTRGIPYSFAKVNGGGETKRAATQSLIRFGALGDQDFALTHATEIGIYLTDLLHLNSHQFRQLVVLAQGEFAALLRMNPSERLKALRDLLGDSYYQRLQTELDERGKAASLKVSRALAETRDTAVQIRGMLSESEVSDLHDRVSELVDSTATDPLAVTREVIENFEEATRSAEVALTDARQVMQPLETEFNVLLQTKEKLNEFVRLTDLVAQANTALTPAELELPADQIPELIARTREQIGQLKPLVDWESGETERELNREQLEIQVSNCGKELQEITDAIETYPQISSQLKAEIADSVQAATRVQDLEKQIEIQEEILTALAELSLLEVMKTDQSHDLEQYKVELVAGEHGVTKAELALSESLREQLVQRVAVLASELRVGEACAVCGSIDHPEPARMEPDIELVTESYIESLKRELLSARSGHKTQLDHLGELQAEIEKTKLALSALYATTTGNSPTAVTAHIETVKLELADQRESRDRLELCESESKQLDVEFAQNKKSVAITQKKLESARRELTSFDTGVNLKTIEISRLLGPGGNVSQEVADLEAKTTRLVLRIDAARDLANLSKSVAPHIRELNASDFDESFIESQEALTAAQIAVENAEQSRTLAVNSLKSATTLVAKFVKESQGVEKLAVEVNDSVTLGSLVTATTSGNTKKLTLESYALQLRFAHVLESASIHLRKMSSGRLSFVLDESTQGRGNTGLGINVMDESTGDPRPTTSLSGGETFYASLSLALGLADVVQSETGGVSLETLFVDEGFGSLDTETLERVLDQLDQLKSGGRTIGVISHVSEMKDRFPDRIVVSREPDGPSKILQG